MTTDTKPALKQLMMIRRQSGRKRLQWRLPEGYLLRNFRSGDEEPYIKLMQLAGFEYWGEPELEGVLKDGGPERTFFIVDKKTCKIAASAMGWHKQIPIIDCSYELGWVACDPQHCGKGLGYIVCASVVNCFLAQKIREIFLRTDDFRLAAIKTYLKCGFVPHYHADDMQQRWEDVFKQLGVSLDD